MTTSIASAVIALISLGVTFLANSAAIFAFFGAEIPHRVNVRASNVRQYVTAIAKHDINAAIIALGITGESSPASEYLLTMSWLWWGAGAMGTPPYASQAVDAGGNTWNVCRAEDLTDCVRYSNFQFNDQDEIVDARRNDFPLDVFTLSLGAPNESEGWTVQPMAGLAHDGWNQYVFRVRNSTEAAARVTGCYRRDSTTGATLSTNPDNGFPKEVQPGSDIVVYCEFQTQTTLGEHDVAVVMEAAERSAAIWTEFV